MQVNCSITLSSAAWRRPSRRKIIIWDNIDEYLYSAAKVKQSRNKITPWGTIDEFHFNEACKCIRDSFVHNDDIEYIWTIIDWSISMSRLLLEFQMLRLVSIASLSLIQILPGKVSSSIPNKV